MEKKAIFYEDRKGSKPVKNFLEQLGNAPKAKILARVTFLAEH